MVINPNEKIVKGNSTNGIAYDGFHYIVFANGDRIETFGDDMAYAEKVYQEKKSKSILSHYFAQVVCA